MSDQAAIAAPRQHMTRLAQRWIIGFLLFVCILSGYLLSYNVDKPTHNADWYIRYQVTCEIVEHNRFNIHPYRSDGRTGPGVNGQQFSQYTLGQTTALIPLYLLGRALAGVAHTNCEATIAQPIVFLTAKSLDLILGALLGVLFFGTARLLGYRRGLALALTLLLAFGTALWSDVLSNLEHTLESLFLLAGSYAALRYTSARRKNRLWILAMGLAAGLVFVTRVAGMIALPIFALYLLMLHRRWRPFSWKRPYLRDLAIYIAGVLPSVIINLAFNAIRFGKPWQFQPFRDDSFGYPPWFGIPNLLISPGKGIIWYVPALFLLVLAVRPFWRRYPLPSQLFAIIGGIYLLFYANVHYWHGDPAWGPRYLYAVLPYLILPLGEVLQNWRAYRLPVRGVIVTVLAASFLVQFSAVTVSYWRHWSYIYTYHGDQVENHIWGQNLNYWWIPDESPIIISLAGISDITQKYVDHAQLLQHAADQRLSNPYESCFYQIYGQAAICLTPMEDLHDNANWNTFTPWWLHAFPWWTERTVITLALSLLAIFLSSGAALIIMLTRTRRPRPILMRLINMGVDVPPPHSNGGNGHGNGNGHNTAIDLVALPPLAVPHPQEHGGGTVTLAVETPVRVLQSAQAATATRAPATGLAPLGLSVVCAMFVYGSIVGVAALRAPRHAPPLIRSYPMTAAIHDGSWSYQVLSVTSLRALPGGLDAPAPGHHYVVIRLRVHNALSRPNPSSLQADSFDLTDAQKLKYPVVKSVLSQAAELYGLSTFGSVVPARSSMDGVLVFLVRDGAQHLELLGPGIALIHLNA